MAKILRRLWLPLLVAVLGLACLSAGILSATVWRPADTQTVSLPQGTKGQVVLTRPGVVNLYSAPLTIRLTGPKDSVIAVGRSTDIAAWADGLAHVRIDGIDSNQTFVTSEVKGEGGTELVSPAGNDMWIQSDEVDGTDATISWDTSEEGQYSVLAYAPSGTPELTLAWKTGASTPWLWPLVIAGGVLLLAAGLLGLVFQRRASRHEHVPAETADDGVASEWDDESALVASVDDRGYDAEGAYAEGEALADSYAGDEGLGDGYGDATYETGEWEGSYVSAPYSYEDEDVAYDSVSPAGYGYEDYETTEDAYGVADPQAYLSDRGVVATPDYDEVPEVGGDVDKAAYDDFYAAEMAYGDEGGDDPDIPLITDYPEPTAQPDYSGETWDRPVIPPTPALPSRRDMREARKRGEPTIEVDGVKFPTGLIPVVRDAVMPVHDSDSGAGSDEFGGESAFEERH